MPTAPESPLSHTKYDTFLQVRLTTHDKERIKARAIEAGMQTSEYVRKRALGERMPHKNYDVHEPPKSFKRLVIASKQQAPRNNP